jgi:hypothetical protein
MTFYRFVGVYGIDIGLYDTGRSLEREKDIDGQPPAFY